MNSYKIKVDLLFYHPVMGDRSITVKSKFKNCTGLSGYILKSWSITYSPTSVLHIETDIQSHEAICID